LPTTPPASLKQRIVLERYVEFANDINAELQWKRWEGIVYQVLHLVYPVILPKYLLWRRKTHCRALLTKLFDKVHILKFWKNEEETMRDLIQIKFTFSSQV